MLSLLLLFSLAPVVVLSMHPCIRSSDEEVRDLVLLKDFFVHPFNQCLIVIEVTFSIFDF